VGARALPPALLGPSADAGESDLGARLERLRLENEALYGVAGVVASSPDLDHVLPRVVDLLTNVSGCHACFVYLVFGDRLRMQAASPLYGRLVGQIEFGVDEGLAGWAVRHGEAAFIRDHALDDPRTNFIPQLEEERFQSMAAIPVPSRSGDILGVIVLHTAAPHEFDEGVLNVLSHTASLIAGAIENAKLYDDAQRRVAALTRLSALSQRIAAVTGRAELYSVATAGVRDLLPCDRCRLLERGEDGAADVLLEVLQTSATQGPRLRSVVGRALGMTEPPTAALAVPIAAGDELLGALVVAADQPWHEHDDELLRAVAHQIAVALKKAELIEHLSAENAARDLFDALAQERWQLAEARARALGSDLNRPHMVVYVRPIDTATFPGGAEAIERALGRTRPGAVCDTDERRVRALVPVAIDGPDGAAQAGGALEAVAKEHGVAIGGSSGRRGATEVGRALGEAEDAALVAASLADPGGGGALLYGQMGAYRYLVPLLESGGPDDDLRAAVDRIVAYDAQRQTQLLATLEQFLASGRSAAATARALTVHVNTLRQRLERIEALTGLELASEDLLALQLALKLARLRRR
jgi:GAF domain-containing protein